MKKNGYAAIALLIAFCLSLFPAVSFSANERRPLSNTIYLLKNKMPLRIGYLGGSITLGAGASAETFGFRQKTTKWFKETFPDNQITEINAAISGFGSVPNAFRVNSQLLIEKPDLIFVEAAVNDWNVNGNDVKDSMEGVVRRIYGNNPKADIIFIYTTSKESSENSYARGQTMKTVIWHEEIAEHYGIPSVNPGYDLYEKIEKGEYSWADLFAADGVHPNDKGHELYTQSLVTFLKSSFEKTPPEKQSDYKMPDKLSKTCYDKADIIDGWSMVYDGFEKSEDSMGGRHPHMIVSNTKGATASVLFEGRAIGLYWLKASDAGIVEWWIDQESPKRISGCDEKALSESARGTYNMLATNLTDGPHTLHLRMTGEKDSGSKDTWVRIGGVFVSEIVEGGIKPQTNSPTALQVRPDIEAIAPDDFSYVPKHRDLFRLVGIEYAPDNNDTVTRSEAAIAIASMLNIGIPMDSEQVFSDVPADHPAFNAVYFLKKTGIVNGDGNNYYPDNAISLNEAAKLMVSAAGYTPLAEQNGGYPSGYLYTLSSAGILKTIHIKDGITPNVFEELIYNTLNAELFEPVSFGSSVIYSKKKDVTLFSKYHNLYSEKGIVTGTPVTSLSGYASTSVGRIRINDTVYNTETAFNELLGHKVQYYYYRAEYNSDAELKVMFIEDISDNTKRYYTDDIVSYENYTYTLTSDFGNRAALKIVPYADIIYNNKRVEKDETYMKPSNGTIEAIDSDNDGKYDVIKIMDYTSVVVGGTDLSNMSVYNLLSAEKISLKDDNYKIINTSGVSVAFEDILKHDIISMAVSEDGDYVSGILSRMYIQGIISEKTTESTEKINQPETTAIVIDNVKYFVSSGYKKTDELTVGSNATFYLDYLDKIVYCAQSKPSNSEYAYVIDSILKTDIEGTRAFLKVLDSSGEIKELSTKSTITYNDTNISAAEAYDKLNDYKGIINYRLNKDMIISQIYSAVSSKSADKTGLYCDNTDGVSLYYRAASLNFGNQHIMNGNTSVFIIPGFSENDEDFAVLDYSVLKTGEYYTMAGYRTVPDKLTCDFVVWYDDGGDFSRYTTPITLIERKTKIVDEDGMEAEKIYGVSEGSKVTYISNISGIFDDVTPGDVIRCFANTGGKIVKAPQIIYDYETDSIKTAVGTNTASNVWVLKGRIYKTEDNVVSLYIGNGSDIADPDIANLVLFSVNSNKAISLYKEDASTNKVSAATINDLRSYESSGNDCSTAVVILNYGDHENLILLKK